MNYIKIKVSILVVLILVIAVQSARSIRRLQHRKVFAAQSLKAKGNPKAGVRIIEFTDFQCPACANGATLLREYLKVYPESLYVQYRYFPLEMHPRAMPIAIAAECAARQNQFWAFHDMVFGRQNLLRETINLKERLQEIAQETGLNLQKYEHCINDPAIAQAVKAEKEEGQARRVDATPTYFIGEQMLVGNVSLQRVLEEKVGRRP